MQCACRRSLYVFQTETDKLFKHEDVRHVHAQDVLGYHLIKAP